VGALIGTIMAGNVFFKIMPAQRLMVDAVANKTAIDPAWGLAAKLRSVHNNYLTLPLLFIMISNHYPMTYQHPQNWLVLILIGLISAWIRHFFNLKHTGVIRPSILITGAAAMLALAAWVSFPGANTVVPAQAPLTQKEESQVNQPVFAVIQKHCVNCHSAKPTDDMFVIAPMGLMLDSWQQVEQKAPLINLRVVVSKDMPFLNKTAMTDDERQIIASWYQQRK
jgi:uncharacterized membrane protein